MPLPFQSKWSPMSIKYLNILLLPSSIDYLSLSTSTVPLLGEVVPCSFQRLTPPPWPLYHPLPMQSCHVHLISILRCPHCYVGPILMHKLEKAIIYFPSLQLKFYSAFAFNICPLPVFATVYRSEVIYILFLPLIFPLEVGANKWENDQKGGRCQAKEKGVRQEKPMK